MKRVLLSGFAFVLFGVSVARADLPPPPPPKPPTKPTKPAFDTTPVVAGSVAATGIVLVGLWLARSRRVRLQPTH